MIDYQCVLAFDRDSAEFARGAEVGALWERLESGPTSAILHGDNAEMALRMAEARGMTARSSELGGDWIEVTFSRVPLGGMA